MRLLIGLGSHHGDDQVGWKLAEDLGRLADLPFRQAAIPAGLLHWLNGVDQLYVFDACQSGGTPGQVYRWQCGAHGQFLEGIIPGVKSLRSMNTHQLSLPDTLSLAHRLEMLPRRVVIWGIEGKSFETGQPLSSEITALLPDILRQLASELDHA
ncbi:MAG: hydrogenase maturation protease [Planctomycetia bacterium]|nr:hydrogenase maturation protease [Planctomycetia bacterium]